MWISLFIYYNFPLGKQLFIKIDSHKEILSIFLDRIRFKLVKLRMIN